MLMALIVVDGDGGDKLRALVLGGVANDREADLLVR
jgi:hypothetical protein